MAELYSRSGRTYTNNAPFATGNKYTANDLSCLKLSLISYVLDVDSSR